MSVSQIEGTNGVDHVKFSVQGCLFILPKESVSAIDWMPSAMIKSEMKANVIDNVFYLDCDAQCFRLLYQIAKEDQPLEIILSLNIIELALLVNTAKYLAMSTYLPQLELQLQETTAVVESAEYKLAKVLKKAFEHRRVTSWKCPRVRPSGFRCNTCAITINNIKDEIAVTCSICNVACVRSTDPDVLPPQTNHPVVPPYFKTMNEIVQFVDTIMF
jgi:hypothetical protein